MNSFKVLFMRVFSRIIIGIVFIFLLGYFSLWTYIIYFVPKELKIEYNKNIESYLNDEQYELITFAINGNKEHKFKWYPFIIDFIITRIQAASATKT